MLVFQVWPPVSFPPLSIPEPLSLMRVQRRDFAHPTAASLSRVQRRRPFRTPNGVSFARPTASLSRAQRNGGVPFARPTERRRPFRAPNGVSFARPTAASLSRAQWRLFRASNGVAFARPTAASLSRAQWRLLFASNGVSFSRPTAALFSRAQRRLFRASNVVAFARLMASRARAERCRSYAPSDSCPLALERRAPACT
jgi:hypothetical protein